LLLPLAERAQTGMSRSILILGGTHEAYDLAKGLSGRAGIHAITSLAGRTDNPRLPSGEMRIGGFGGIPGLSAYLRDTKIDAVVDATHPFAARMGWNAARACAETSTPLLRLERPAWQPGPGDCWHGMIDGQQAAQWLNTHGKRVLLAVGRQDLDAFVDLDHVWFLIRSVQAPERFKDFAQAEILLARGPFAPSDEHDLLVKHRIDTIVCKNSGGITDAKLLAARQLGLSVVMLERPHRPQSAVVHHVDAALKWLGF